MELYFVAIVYEKKEYDNSKSPEKRLLIPSQTEQTDC